MKVDLLAIAAHPDDVELGVGGWILALRALGYQVGIVDLTRGEMGSRGTSGERRLEAEAAAKLLGVEVRRNLDLGDGHLELNIASRHALATVIRELQPTFLASPYFEDRHPDHAAAGQLIKYASYDARMSMLDLGLPPYACSRIFYFPCHEQAPITVVANITDTFQRKMEAVRAYKSQFSELHDKMYINYKNIPVAEFLFHIESRARYFGSLIGVPYGEGFYTEQPLPFQDPYRLL